MEIPYKKHKGKSLEEVLFIDPDYLCWLISKNAELKNPKNYIHGYACHSARLIEIFDIIPFQKDCSSELCKNTASHCLISNAMDWDPTWICKKCLDVYINNGGRFSVINTFKSAINFVANRCNGRSADKVRIINYLARAKGLPPKATPTQMNHFFEYKKPEPWRYFFEG